MAPSHYLNQCWNIVIWTLRNKLQRNFNWNLYIFIQENAFEHVVCEMAFILSRPQCVNQSWARSMVSPGHNGLTSVMIVNISPKQILYVINVYCIVHVSQILNCIAQDTQIQIEMLHCIAHDTQIQIEMLYCIAQHAQISQTLWAHIGL